MTRFHDHIIDDGQQFYDVQTGEVTIPAGGNNVTAVITAVNLSKSFVIFGSKRQDSVNPMPPEDNFVKATFQSTTQVRFEVYDNTISGNGIIIRYWVIEGRPHNPISVQHGNQVGVGNIGAPTNILISAVNLSNAFALISHENDGSTPGAQDFIRARLTTTTNLELAANASNANCEVSYQVINNPRWTVQAKDISLTPGNLSANAAITAVTLAHSWLAVSGTFDTAAVGNNMVRAEYNGTTQVDILRLANTNTSQCTVFCIDTKGDISVQHITCDIGLNNLNQTAVITAVNLSRAAIQTPLFSDSLGCLNGTNMSAQRVMARAIFNSTVQMQYERSQAAGGDIPQIHNVMEVN